MAERNGIRYARMFRVVCGIGVEHQFRSFFRPADEALFHAKGDDRFIADLS